MKNRKNSILSDAESQIMSILWEIGPATVQQVCQSHDKKLAYTTVATMLKILENKGYVTHEIEGRTYVYTPVKSREQVGQWTIQYIVNRFFKGSYQGLVNNLVQNGNLDLKDLAKLKTIVEQQTENSGQ